MCPIKTIYIDANPQNIEDISLNGYANSFVAPAVKISIEVFRGCFSIEYNKKKVTKIFLGKDEIGIPESALGSYAELTNLEKNFNKANFAKYLGYKIKIDGKQMLIFKIL